MISAGRNASGQICVDGALIDPRSTDPGSPTTSLISVADRLHSLRWVERDDVRWMDGWTKAVGRARSQGKQATHAAIFSWDERIFPIVLAAT